MTTKEHFDRLWELADAYHNGAIGHDELQARNREAWDAISADDVVGDVLAMIRTIKQGATS
jgi:hypothetical protein